MSEACPSAAEHNHPVSYSRAEQVHIIMPADCNQGFRLFGGKLMEWVDVVAAVVARRHSANQPPVAARTLVGDDAHFDSPPYFFTDQYNVGMEFRGQIPEEYTLIQRGEGEEYLVFWLNPEGVVRAAMNVNIWDQGDALDALLAEGRPVDAADLADPGKPLDSLSDG